MAFGITPHHTEDIAFGDLSAEQFLAIAVEAAKKLKWNVYHISAKGFIASTRMSWSSWNEEVKLTIDEDKATIRSACLGSQMFDWGKNKRNVEKFLAAFEEVKATTTAEQLSGSFQELQTSFADPAEDVLAHPAPRQTVNDFISIFKPTEGYFITPVIVWLNIAIFIAMVASGADVMSPDSETLLKWGANFRPVTLEGEWWRLLTCCFIHIGILHLLMNMYALVYIGLLLEPYLGRTRFLAAYLLTGVTASLTSVWWHDITVSAGASGAIFGMYGVFLAMLTTNLIEKTARQSLLTSIGIFVLYNLTYGMKGGVDNAAHIGGLIGGLVMGYAFYPSLKSTATVNLKYATVALMGVLILAASYVALGFIPNDIGKYQKAMNKFSAMETAALDFYSMPKNSTNEAMLAEIKDSGLYYWGESLKLLREVDALKLPDNIHTKNQELIRYCRLRESSYELLYKTIDENTDRYRDSLEYYNNELERSLKSLQ